MNALDRCRAALGKGIAFQHVGMYDHARIEIPDLSKLIALADAVDAFLAHDGDDELDALDLALKALTKEAEAAEARATELDALAAVYDDDKNLPRHFMRVVKERNELKARAAELSDKALRLQSLYLGMVDERDAARKERDDMKAGIPTTVTPDDALRAVREARDKALDDVLNMAGPSGFGMSPAFAAAIRAMKGKK